MVERKTRRERKVVLDYLAEQIALMEDAFEPSLEKSLEHIKKKFGLKDINFKYRIDWKMKVEFIE